MRAPTHQTVKLARGKHASPSDGACVMELASMLAGESFDDHPSSVCPVIGMVLRAYNDGVDDERRQDLYRWAAEVVEYRPYTSTDTNFSKLRQNLAKYNPSAATVDKIVASLSL